MKSTIPILLLHLALGSLACSRSGGDAPPPKQHATARPSATADLKSVDPPHDP